MTPKEQIRVAIASLNDVERQQLMAAFNNMEPERIDFKDGTFIGCNLPVVEDVVIDASHGYWVYGRRRPAQ